LEFDRFGTWKNANNQLGRIGVGFGKTVEQLHQKCLCEFGRVSTN
jgi:hypothetical protein